MSETLLDFSHASVGYAGRTVVADASLQVRAGEVVGLIGPNGAGKSTLVRAVTGDAGLLAGSLEIAGAAAGSLSPRDRALLVGVVPQTVSAAFAVSARAFVEMGRHAHLPRFAAFGPEDRAAVEGALALTDTLRLADTPTDELSGGDLQRLAFAQALAQQPRLLLLDEPVSHLDLNHRLQVLDLMRVLCEHEGMGALVVFHELDLAARYADRIAMVSEGRLGEADTPERVITADALRDVFGVRAVVGVDPVTGSVSVTPVLREGARAAERRERVLVVGGSGAAAPLLRRLVLDGWDVVCGALNAGDADAVLCEALGLDYAPLPPFAPMDAESAVRVARLAESAAAIVVCDVPFGSGNVDNLLVSVRAGRPLVLVGGIAGRDFTGGAAESLWAEALDAGAEQVGSLEAAERALGALFPRAGR